MEAIAWTDDVVNAMDRDPRSYPFGYFTGGASPLDTARVFVWFATLEELLEHILEVEPRVHGLVRGEGLEGFQQRIRPLLQRATEEGLSEALRLELDPGQRRWIRRGLVGQLRRPQVGARRLRARAAR